MQEQTAFWVAGPEVGGNIKKKIIAQWFKG